jgi:hypothetical protein
MVAAPHRIIISDPRLSPEIRATAVYDFGVDVPIPIVELALSEEHTIAIDFNAPYQRTFNTNRYYGTILVDYEQLPPNFESYTEADQQRIRERMKLVAETS